MMQVHRSKRRLSRPPPFLLPLPCSARSHEARRTGVPYRLGVQEFAVSATQRVDRPETRMDAGQTFAR